MTGKGVAEAVEQLEDMFLGMPVRAVCVTAASGHKLGGLVRCTGEAWVGPSSCCAWNRCPSRFLPKVEGCLGEVGNGVNIFRPVVALIGHKYGVYFCVAQ